MNNNTDDYRKDIRMMRKHTLLTGLAAIMTITALTGCGSVNDPIQDTETQPETKEETVIETDEIKDQVQPQEVKEDQTSIKKKLLMKTQTLRI